MTVSRVMTVVLAAGFLAVSATSALANETVEIRAVPPIAGLELIVDGQRVVTDTNGLASAVVADSDAVDIRQAHTYTKAGTGVRASIGRIDRRGLTFTARLDLEYSVKFRFTTADGERVDNETIELIDLRSSSGRVERFEPTGTAWLQGLRVARHDGGATPKDVWWSVDDVRVRETTVVNRSQQRFRPSDMPARDRTVDIELLFFDAKVRVRDAFLGSPIRGDLVVEGPDGTIEQHALDADGNVDLGDVPRGEYRMAVEGHGLRISRPVTISRDVDEELRFYSWLDVGVFAGFIGLFLWGSVAIGVRRRRSYDSQAPRTTHGTVDQSTPENRTDDAPANADTPDDTEVEDRDRRRGLAKAFEQHAQRPHAWGLLAVATVCVVVALPETAAAQTASTVRTVPAIPGVRVEVGGHVAATDQEGVARFGGLVRISRDMVRVVDKRMRLSDRRRVRFDELRRTDTGYVAAFDVDYRVAVDAVTAAGRPIDADRADQIWLRSPLTGAEAVVRIGENVWLHGTRVVSELGTVRLRDLPWTVQKFSVDGEQVVNRGQQRFVPAEEQQIVVQARLFSADITVRDALFGSPTGNAVLLRRPDGTTSRHLLDVEGTVQIPDLVPGLYAVTVTGSGPLVSRPVRLSRNQYIQFDVYSWWDVAIAAVAGLLFFAGLAIAGRRRSVDTRARTGSDADSSPDAHVMTGE